MPPPHRRGRRTWSEYENHEDEEAGLSMLNVTASKVKCINEGEETEGRKNYVDICLGGKKTYAENEDSNEEDEEIGFS